MKITVATIAINSWYREIVKYSLKNTREYCEKHGYNFYLLTEDDPLAEDRFRHPAWYKMKLIRYLIEKGECDYILWLDADSQILKMEQKLEYFFDKYVCATGKELALVREYPINTGIMFIRCSEYNYRLMDEIWNNTNEYDKAFWDQGSLKEIYNRDENVRNKLEVIQFGIQDEIVTYWGGYYPGRSFIIHLARCAFNTLDFLYMMDAYYKGRLDEENDEQYIKRVEWINEISICRQSIDKWLNKEYFPRLYSQRCLSYMNMKYLIHWFPFCSGGLCDRILGLSSNLCIAKALGRKLLIKWDNADLKPVIHINSKHNYYHENNKVNFRHVNLNNFESMDYFKTVDIKNAWGDENIMIWSNVNLYNYLLQNPYFKEHKETTNPIKNLSEAIVEILINYFSIDQRVFDNYKKYDVGIHIRTGDKQIYDKDKEEFYRDYITDIFRKIKEEGSIKPEQTIFISSDCQLTFKIASDFFDKFYHNEGDVIHTAVEDKITEDGVVKVLLDLFNLCNCKSTLYIGWHSNFSRIASLFNTKRKIISYEYDNDPKVVKEISAETLFSFHSKGKYT